MSTDASRIPGRGYVVLICCRPELDLEAELGSSLFWRREFERLVATEREAAVGLLDEKPDVVLIDRDLDWAVAFVKGLRAGAATRQLSVAVFAGGDVEPVELELLEAGANAVLRLPPGVEWDKRLARLMHLSARRQARFTVLFQVATSFSARGETSRATALNLSESGMLLEGEGLAVGKDLYVAFQLPGRAGLITGRARVVREAGGGRFGIEFTELEGDFLTEIKGFVEPLTPES